jgi:hypothetical protein
MHIGCPHVCKYKDFMVATGEAMSGQMADHEAKYVSIRSVGREVQLNARRDNV